MDNIRLTTAEARDVLLERIKRGASPAEALDAVAELDILLTSMFQDSCKPESDFKSVLQDFSEHFGARAKAEKKRENGKEVPEKEATAAGNCPNTPTAITPAETNPVRAETEGRDAATQPIAPVASSPASAPVVQPVPGPEAKVPPAKEAAKTVDSPPRQPLPPASVSEPELDPDALKKATEEKQSGCTHAQSVVFDNSNNQHRCQKCGKRVTAKELAKHPGYLVPLAPMAEETKALANDLEAAIASMPPPPKTLQGPGAAAPTQPPRAPAVAQQPVPVPAPVVIPQPLPMPESPARGQEAAGVSSPQGAPPQVPAHQPVKPTVPETLSPMLLQIKSTDYSCDKCGQSDLTFTIAAKPLGGAKETARWACNQCTGGAVEDMDAADVQALRDTVKLAEVPAPVVETVVQRPASAPPAWPKSGAKAAPEAVQVPSTQPQVTPEVQEAMEAPKMSVDEQVLRAELKAVVTGWDKAAQVARWEEVTGSTYDAATVPDDQLIFDLTTSLMGQMGVTQI